jgi:hypothetical protein
MFANWVKNVFFPIPFNSLPSHLPTFYHTYLILIKLVSNVRVNITDYLVFIAIVATGCIFYLRSSIFL